MRYLPPELQLVNYLPYMCICAFVCVGGHLDVGVNTEYGGLFPFFSVGFAQGHDTFLKGFGTPGLIIPSIIQWLAGR